MTASDNSIKSSEAFTRPVSGDDFVRFLTEKTRDQNCIICGHPDFTLLCQPNSTDMLELRLPVAFGTSPEPYGWYGLAYTCANCGHLFTMSKLIVIHWLSANPSPFRVYT